MTRPGKAYHRRWTTVVVGVVLLCGAAAGPADGQQGTSLARVRAAFVAGDARALLDGAAERVEIALMGQGRLYSRSQATYVMQDFFRAYPPAALALENESRQEGSWIAAGPYRYRQGERPLQVYVRLRMRGTRWELREIRIEERRRE